MTTPKVFVCAGGGGVGKTTTSAALALALARNGARTLIVTVDPARRLANAMGVAIDPDVHAVHVEGEPQGLLFALMPEPRKSTHTFVELLFEDQPEAYERILQNRIYATLGDALAGIHELVSLMLVARAVEEARYDYLVIDTAPSRYALDFIRYPGRLADLFEGRAVAWFGSLAQRARAQQAGEEAPSDEGGLLAWGKKRVEATVTRVLDPRTVLDVTNLFADLAMVRHRFASLARASESLLLGSSARYVIVAAPSGAARADVRFIAGKLDDLGQKPAAIVLNRADEALPAWVDVLGSTPELTLPVHQALELLRAEHAARRTAGDEMARAFQAELRRRPVLRLPTIETRDPTKVVRTLADELAPHLASL